MKTFVLVICLLTVAHAHDCKKQEEVEHLLKEYAAKFSKCECQPKDITLSPEAWYYALSYLETINKNGTVNKQKTMEYCHIYEDAVVNDCKEMICECLKKAKTSGSEEKEPKEETLTAIECVIKDGHGKMMESEKNKCKKRQCD